MNPRRYEMALLRDARSHPTLEGLASSAGIHTAVIPRLRCDLGINLAGIADILEMIERLRAVQCENDLLRSRL